jgi:hypothetical protein
MSNDTHIIASCLFGQRFSRVYPAIQGRRCCFFSNNARLAPEVESKGWEYRLVSTHAMSADERISSQQSKYVKFLQFLRDFPEFQTVEAVTYFDHKFFVKEAHVSWILEHIAPDKSVLIRTTPKLKLSIADEVAAAMPQRRYAERMPQTLAWVSALKAERGIAEAVRIVNTGLIHYRNLARIMPLLDDIYGAVWALGQPECQIIWAALAQAYECHIQRVAWEDLNPLWAAP